MLNHSAISPDPREYFFFPPLKLLYLFIWHECGRSEDTWWALALSFRHAGSGDWFRLLLGFLQAESSLGVERSHEQVHSFGTCDTFDAIDVVCVTFSWSRYTWWLDFQRTWKKLKHSWHGYLAELDCGQLSFKSLSCGRPPGGNALDWVRTWGVSIAVILEREPSGYLV